MATKTLWATLDEFLVHKGTGKSMHQKKWSNNTWVLMNYVDGSISVRLHGTDVVRAEQNGDITLRTGGYYTVTTKARINEFLTLAGTGWKVFQKNHDWFISHYAGGGQWDVTEPFHDLMTLYALTEEPAPIIKEADPLLEALLKEEEEIEAAHQAKLAMAVHDPQGPIPVVDANKLVHIKGVGVFNENKLVEGDTEQWQAAAGKKTLCVNCNTPIHKDKNYVWVDVTGGDGCSGQDPTIEVHLSPWGKIVTDHQ